LTSIVRSKTAGSIDATVPFGATPALAITTSIPPKRRTVPAIASSSADRSVTSASNHAARSPSSAARRSSSSGSSPTSATFAPRPCRRRAASAPIPRVAPVTSTVLPEMPSSRPAMAEKTVSTDWQWGRLAY
jgi:hypothetical protein